MKNKLPELSFLNKKNRTMVVIATIMGRTTKVIVLIFFADIILYFKVDCYMIGGGGGIDPNIDCNSIQSAAFAHCGMPAFQTYVSLVN